ncbi:hypothetical protein COOONC_01891 [Cooperia oncophora]
MPMFRTMAVLEGLKLTIENFDEMNLPSTVTVPDFPSDLTCEKNHHVAFDRVVYIERTDYRQCLISALIHKIFHAMGHRLVNKLHVAHHLAQKDVS